MVRAQLPAQLALMCTACLDVVMLMMIEPFRAALPANQLSQQQSTQHEQPSQCAPATLSVDKPSNSAAA
jgi:hypothetical protein